MVCSILRKKAINLLIVEEKKTMVLLIYVFVKIQVCESSKLHFFVTVMASLSVYSVSEPLGLTLESQCALETVKRDLPFDELLFGTKQLKQKSRQNW